MENDKYGWYIPIYIYIYVYMYISHLPFSLLKKKAIHITSISTYIKAAKISRLQHFHLGLFNLNFSSVRHFCAVFLLNSSCERVSLFVFQSRLYNRPLKYCIFYKSRCKCESAYIINVYYY